MFTGIVESSVPVRSFTPVGEGAELVLPFPEVDDWSVEPGQSIAVSGACLTVAERVAGPGGAADMLFHLSAETLDRTWFRALAPGREVNVERAMILGERLDGHLVSGHVDGGGELIEIEDVGDGGALYRFDVASELERYLIEKGSVTLDGISLTVVEPRAGSFQVALIPVSLERTNLGSAVVGQRFNVEVDMIGKWIERLLVGR